MNRALALISACQLFSVSAFALSTEQIAEYLREHPSETSYAQFRSLLMNGMVVWEASATTEVTYRVYYGPTPGEQTKYRDVGAARSFSLPHWLKGESYYVAIVAMKDKAVSVRTKDLKVQRSEVGGQLATPESVNGGGGRSAGKRSPRRSPSRAEAGK